MQLHSRLVLDEVGVGGQRLFDPAQGIGEEERRDKHQTCHDVV